MANLNKNIQNKLIDTFITSFDAMPKWLKNFLIVSLIFGFFYFGYIRKEVVFKNENIQIEEIDRNLNKLNKKIQELEDIKKFSKHIDTNVDDVISLHKALSEEHRREKRITMNYLKNIANNQKEFNKYETLMDSEDERYNQEINSILERRLHQKLEELNEDDN